MPDWMRRFEFRMAKDVEEMIRELTAETRQSWAFIINQALREYLRRELDIIALRKRESEARRAKLMPGGNADHD